MTSPHPVGNTVARAARFVVDVVRETYEQWRADRAIRLGAGLAYYAVFTAVPLVASAIGIAGIVFTDTQIHEFLINSLNAILARVPEDVAGAANRLADTIDASAASGGLTVIGAIGSVFGASLFFIALQDAFNVIWQIPVRSGFRSMLQRRLLAFGLVMLAGAVLVASLSVQAVLLVVDEIFGGNIGDTLNADNVLINLATWGFGWVAASLLFQLLIEARLNWRNTFVVTGLIGLFLVIGTWAVGFYFSRWGTASLSGVSGGVVVILTWFYYLAQVIVAGAVLLRTLEERTAGESPNG